jgi:hypothetical protein
MENAAVEGFRSVPLERKVAREDTPLPPCCCSASCRQVRTIIITIPLSKKTSIPSMKTTLQEKLELIPATPESPATLAGSLQPSQAIRDGKLLISSAPNSVNDRSML